MIILQTVLVYIKMGPGPIFSIFSRNVDAYDDTEKAACPLFMN